MTAADQRLADMRARAASSKPVDWASVRRVTALPMGERDEADQALIDAYVR